MNFHNYYMRSSIDFFVGGFFLLISSLLYVALPLPRAKTVFITIVDICFDSDIYLFIPFPHPPFNALNKNMKNICALFF